MSEGWISVWARRLLPIGMLGFCGLAVLALASPGCNWGKDGNEAGNGKVTAGADTKSAEMKPPTPPKPPFEGWEKPAAVIVLSGEQHGYIEPCGCTATQSGGLARRYDLFRQLKAKGWPATALDLGGTLRRARRQSQIKFQTIVESLAEMPYAAVALGPEELRVGLDTLLQLHRPDDGLPFVCANVKLYNTDDLGRLTSRTVEVGGVKIGVTAILGAGYKRELLPESSTGESMIEIANPTDALPAVLETLQSQQPDLLVLLSHAPLEESRGLASKFPQFDLILSAGGPEDPEGKPEQIGRTQLVTVGVKGKSVGVVGYFPDAQQKLRFELVNLDKDRFQAAPEMRARMVAYQDTLRDEKLAETEPALAHPSGAEFVGAEKCGACHKKAFSKWSTTKHAHAFESLSRGRKEQEATWVSRIYDPECLACHVTGWQPQEALRYTSGYQAQQTTPHLLGQQCENCHGPGSRHVEEEEIWQKQKGQLSDELVKWRKAAHLDAQLAKDKVCYQCHDLDNSPTFEYDKYWKEVVHPWRD